MEVAETRPPAQGRSSAHDSPPPRKTRGTRGPWQQQLAGKLELHDVPDVEGLCRAVLVEYFQKHSLVLPDHERDDMLAYLLEESWILSTRWDPARGVPFRLYAFGMLRNRLIDYVRRPLGRGARAVDHVELEALEDRLECPKSESAFDRADGSHADDGGCLADRDSRRSEDLAKLGLVDALRIEA